MTPHEFRNHDIITKHQRTKPTSAPSKRNRTNDLANASILIFIIICGFGLVQVM